jgi:hypothetical protein
MDCCSREATITQGEDQVERADHQEIAENRSVSEQSFHNHRQYVIRITVKFVTCLARQLVYRNSNVMCMNRNLYSMIRSRRHKSCCHPHHAKSTVLDRREHQCSLWSSVSQSFLNTTQYSTNPNSNGAVFKAYSSSVLGPQLPVPKP